MDSELQKKIRFFFEQNTCKLEVIPEHLASTELCDFDHPILKGLHQKLTANLIEPEKIANRLYDFIREKILYEFDAWAVTASETILKNTGMCFNKSNLMIALLRLSQIPCVFSLFWIGKNGFRFTADAAMFDKIQNRTVHAYVEAYLGEQIGWRRYVDTSLDAKLRRVLIKQGYEPFQNILTDFPIERFASAEEVIAWRKRYKQSIGAEEMSVTQADMKSSNERLNKLRTSH